MAHSHDTKSISQRLKKHKTQSYLRDWIYGGIDGAVTTFAVVSGVTGGKLSAVVIIILGFANLIADGFSMAASNYLGTKSEQEEYERYKKQEELEVEECPEGEIEEIRQIFKNEGYSGKDLASIVKLTAKNKRHWINLMLHEEFGLPKNIRSPIKSALTTFWAFIVCGLVPLLSYLFPVPKPFLWSMLLTAVVFFAIGSIKSRWTAKPWWRSGLSTLIIGVIVAALAYFVGLGLHNLVVQS